MRGPVEGRFPRVGQGFAEFGLEVGAGVLLWQIQYLEGDDEE